MNKQLINKILLVVVISIWGYIIYQFFVKDKKEVVSDHYITNKPNTDKQSVLKDTFVFKPLSRDPFLGNLKKKTIHRRKKQTPVPKKKPQKSYYRWPKIEYKGYLKKHAAKNKSILVRVDGKLKKYYANDSILNEIKIEKIAKNSIELSCKGNLKTVYRK